MTKSCDLFTTDRPYILGTSLEDHVTETIYDKVYEHFVEEIDAIDNGVNQFDGEPR
jgi:uncharacterized UPF0160 family protein